MSARFNFMPDDAPPAIFVANPTAAIKLPEADARPTCASRVRNAACTRRDAEHSYGDPIEVRG